jgi:hypothetical protein
MSVTFSRIKIHRLIERKSFIEHVGHASYLSRIKIQRLIKGVCGAKHEPHFARLEVLKFNG